MLTYSTRDRDVLDNICWAHYGTLACLEQLLEYNAHVAEYGCILPRGVEIKLPAFKLTTEKGIQLWD